MSNCVSGLSVTVAIDAAISTAILASATRTSSQTRAVSDPAGRSSPHFNCSNRYWTAAFVMPPCRVGTFFVLSRYVR